MLNLQLSGADVVFVGILKDKDLDGKSTSSALHCTSWVKFGGLILDTHPNIRIGWSRPGNQTWPIPKTRAGTSITHRCKQSLPYLSKQPHLIYLSNHKALFVARVGAAAQPMSFHFYPDTESMFYFLLKFCCCTTDWLNLTRLFLKLELHAIQFVLSYLNFGEIRIQPKVYQFLSKTTCASAESYETLLNV